MEDIRMGKTNLCGENGQHFHKIENTWNNYFKIVSLG